MSRPSRCTVPLSISVSPAIIRSRVDLPQPDGPTKTMNSPFSIDRSTPLMARCVPNRFSTLFNSRKGMADDSSRYRLSCLTALLDRAEGQPLHQLLLAEPADHDNG